VRSRSTIIIAVLLVSLLSISWSSPDRARSDSRPQGKQLLSDTQVKTLFLLMDTDKDGKISKEEWMNFMASTFDHLDLNKTGKLDTKELSQLTMPGITFASAGK
jgi:Ca2+-binding EF-hand superfamily protein